MRGLSPLDTAFFGALKTGPSYSITNITTDDGDDYGAGTIVTNTLEGGTVNASYPWDGKWQFRNASAFGVLAEEDWEEYSNGDPINGKSGGVGAWSAAWVNR